jgi:23S rRNA pseudouridine1911/1915/1917 synthase
MIVAKNDGAHRSLAEEFKERDVGKRYLALVWGHMGAEEGTVSSHVGRHPVHRKRMSIKDKGGKEAVTRWRVIRTFPGLSRLDIDLKTGRTHQIRIHLSSLGHPVVGDPLYGGRRAIRGLSRGPLRDYLTALNQPVLHASRLRVRHPHTGERLEFEAPLPSELAELFRILEEPC